MAVRIGTSGCGMVCASLSPQGGPEAIAKLATPSGRPFQTKPPDYSASVRGSVISFLVRSPASCPSILACVLNTRRAGAEANIVIAGDTAWLQGTRPEAETAAALEATFPQVPKVWLQEATDMLQRQAEEDGAAIRCSPRYLLPHLHGWPCCHVHHNTQAAS